MEIKKMLKLGFSLFEVLLQALLKKEATIH